MSIPRAAASPALGAVLALALLAGCAFSSDGTAKAWQRSSGP
jgi:hypothetical protein